MAPTDRVFICRECLSKHFENVPPERIDLGDCIECGLKEVGYNFDVGIVRRKQ